MEHENTNLPGSLRGMRLAAIPVVAALATACATTTTFDSARFSAQLKGCRIYMFKPLGSGASIVSLSGCVVEDSLDVPEYGPTPRYRVLQVYAKDENGKTEFRSPALVQFDADPERLPERVRQRAGAGTRVPVEVRLAWSGVTAVDGEPFVVLPPDKLLPPPRAGGQAPASARKESSARAVTWCKTTPKVFHLGVSIGGEEEESGPRMFRDDCGPVTVTGTIRSAGGPVSGDVIALPIDDKGGVSLTFGSDGSVSGPHAPADANGQFNLSIDTKGQDVGKPFALAVLTPRMLIMERDGKPFVLRLQEGPRVSVGMLDVKTDQ